MIEGQETEIKLLASPSRLSALLTHPLLAGEERREELRSTYFDTADRGLQAAGASLRLRESGAPGANRREQTFKRPLAGAASIEREEWTVAIEDERPDPALFAPATRAALTHLLAGAEPELVATTRVERRIRRVRHGQSLIELAFDTGAIEAGGRSEPICEVELELVEGQLADCLELALALGPGPELRWSVSAKSERCAALATGRLPEAVRASPVTFADGQDVAKGLQTIGWNCLGQLLGNLELVTEQRDNEAVHQARVAVRRLRAGLKLFQGAIGAEGDTGDDTPGIGHFRARFREVAQALGPARDLHVLLEHLEAAAPREETGAGEVGAGDALVTELTARREAALASAGAALASGPVQRLLLEFAIWLEGLGGAGSAADTDEADGLTVFAAKRLKRCRKKLRRKGRDLGAMSDGELHRLRLAVKKLRYAVGFFAPLWDSASDRKDSAKYEKLLGRLQDQLGVLHDVATAQSDGARWFVGLDPAMIAVLAAELELRLAHAGPAPHGLKHKAARSLRRLLDRPCWWDEALRENTMGHADDEHADYADELRKLQIRLSRMQRQVLADGRKLLIIIEGRDAAGKDGTIKRIVEHMSPRDTRVVALGVPNERDRRAWYFQRWASQLPVAGEIVLFNRSWYNRAGVEHVMGFCSDAEYEEFMETVVLFEQLLAHSGFTLLKYYLDISKAEQKRRLKDRESDPLKQWKVSPIDRKAVKNWDKYSKARDAMLARTHSIFAPWVVVKADDKPRARLAIIRDILARGGMPEDEVDQGMLPDPTSAFLYDPIALAKGYLAP